jgi:hypothetical protein
MRGLRHYVNGQLLMAVDYAWAPVAGGWVLKSVDRRVLRDGKVAAVLHVGATGPAEVAARGVVSDVLAHLGAAAAHAVTPRELDAQVFSGPCRTQALNYYAAQAALTAAILALENNPSPLTAALVVAASAHAITAEMAYWLCQENVDSKNTPLGGKGNAGPMPSVPLLPCEMNWATCETPEIQ